MAAPRLRAGRRDPGVGARRADPHAADPGQRPITDRAGLRAVDGAGPAERYERLISADRCDRREVTSMLGAGAPPVVPSLPPMEPSAIGPLVFAGLTTLAVAVSVIVSRVLNRRSAKTEEPEQREGRLDQAA